MLSALKTQFIPRSNTLNLLIYKQPITSGFLWEESLFVLRQIQKSKLQFVWKG